MKLLWKPRWDHSRLLLWLLCSLLRLHTISCDSLSLHFSSSGYNTVVRIPAGATNIDIKQVSYSGKSEDDNYLGECVSVTIVCVCVCVSVTMWFYATLYRIAGFLGRIKPKWKQSSLIRCIHYTPFSSHLIGQCHYPLT